MAGKPAARMKRAVAEVVQALERNDIPTAREALIKAKAASEETGVPMPALPPEANMLWEIVFSTSEERTITRREVRQTRLSDEVRKLLIEAGELAAQRMVDLLSDDSLFEGPRRAAPKDLVPLLNLAIQRAYGTAPIGAQQISAKPEDVEPGKPVGQTLSMMIRSRQAQPAPMRDVTPAIDMVPEGDREGYDDSDMSE
jgi:hypothetical protein